MPCFDFRAFPTETASLQYNNASPDSKNPGMLICLSISEMKELVEKYKEIIQKMETEETDIEDRLEVYREQIYLYMDMKEFGSALTLCEKLLESDVEKERNLYLKADILRQDGKYKDALKIFLELDKNNPDYEIYAFNAARC